MEEPEALAEALLAGNAENEFGYGIGDGFQTKTGTGGDKEGKKSVGKLKHSKWEWSSWWDCFLVGAPLVDRSRLKNSDGGTTAPWYRSSRSHQTTQCSTVMKYSILLFKSLNLKWDGRAFAFGWMTWDYNQCLELDNGGAPDRGSPSLYFGPWTFAVT